MKPANYAPVYAAALYPQWAEIAREHGYALAVHGSLATNRRKNVAEVFLALGSFAAGFGIAFLLLRPRAAPSASDTATWSLPPRAEPYPGFTRETDPRSPIHRDTSRDSPFAQ